MNFDQQPVSFFVELLNHGNQTGCIIKDDRDLVEQAACEYVLHHFFTTTTYRPGLSSMLAGIVATMVKGSIQQETLLDKPSSAYALFDKTLTSQETFWVKRLTNLANVLVKAYRIHAQNGGEDQPLALFFKTQLKLDQLLAKEKYFAVCASWAQWVGVSPHPLTSSNLRVPQNTMTIAEVVSHRVVMAHFEYRGHDPRTSEILAIISLRVLRETLCLDRGPTGADTVTPLLMEDRVRTELYRQERDSPEYFTEIGRCRQRLTRFIREMALRYYEDEIFYRS